MMHPIDRKPELLAPAGQIESFYAAVENGADAVYMGLKRLSARVSATNFTLDELATLLPFARARGVSIYVALNSAVTAPELPEVLDLLQALSDLQVDALIVHDPGVLHLARTLFPSLRLHASTLMAVHNSAGVEQLGRMGAQRVVLARELNLQELERIAAATRVELEIFIHGALCYSYSGLCLTSSYRGGHSGLQGACVQPCRLRFRQGRREGFFLSCNDLCVLPLLPRLKHLRIAGFKIEGRMKSADYIGKVVRAYRIALDASPDREETAIAEAQELLAQSPARRLTPGYLGDIHQQPVLSPHRSGSSGLWVGTVSGVVEQGRVAVDLRRGLLPGDRLRPEKEGRERSAFTVSSIFSRDGSPAASGAAGERVLLGVTGSFAAGERLFKVGEKTESASSIWQKVNREVAQRAKYRRSFPEKGRVLQEWEEACAVGKEGAEETLVLKLSSAQHLARAMQSSARWVMLTASQSNLEKLARQKLTIAQKKKFAWSLPPLIPEKDMGYYRSALGWYVEKGFRTWEVNNWGHFDLLGSERTLNLFAGSRLNLRNAAAVAALAAAGCRWSVLSLEITREELEQLAKSPLAATPIVCVYSWPPLFLSRLIPAVKEDKPFFSPKEDAYHLRRRAGYTYIFADRPIDWFEQLPLLRSSGYRWFMIDLSEGPADQGEEMDAVLNGFRSARGDKAHSLFNFERRARGTAEEKGGEGWLRSREKKGKGPAPKPAQAKERKRPRK